MPELQHDLTEAFKTLDEDRLAVLATASGHDPGPLTDANRVALAFGYLIAGDKPLADAAIAGVSGDGTAPLADFALVRAFRYSIDGNHAATVQAMMHHIDDPKATHPTFMRLRLADSLLKLGRHDDLKRVLRPFLDPPGNEHTLEAALIIMESMLKNNIRGDALIEQAALIDLLVERGFRLSKPEHVVYYADLLHTGKAEGVVAAILSGHAASLDAYTPTLPTEIEFLLTAGDKYKVPAAVRASGRGYVEHPARFRTSDPENAAYLYTSHEEHRAARAVMVAHFSKSAIAKNPSLARTMIILNYYAHEWKDTLDLIREHRALLLEPELKLESSRIRVACEYHLGRYAEALATADALGPNLQAESTDAAVAAALSALALSDHDRAHALDSNFVKAPSRKDDEVLRYFSEIAHDIVLRENNDALTALINSVRSLTSAPLLGHVLDMIGDQVVRFSWMQGIEKVSAAFSTHGSELKALYFSALKAIENGETSVALSLANSVEKMSPAAGEPAAIVRTLAHRRAGDDAAAFAACESALRNFPESFPLMGTRIGLLKKSGRAEELAAAQRDTMVVIDARARNREEHEFFRSRVAAAAALETCESRSEQLGKLAQTDFDSVETLRIARVILRASGSSPADKKLSRDIEQKWTGKNLLPHW